MFSLCLCRLPPGALLSSYMLEGTGGGPHRAMGCFRCEDVRRLLHNKYVAVLGDSIQRSVYKDLVKLLQGDKFLSEKELRSKGEKSFANDTLVEGGSLSEMHNGVTYREVRQYRTGHHLVRFYFLTRAYSEYIESVLADFKSGPQPDVLIVNSCIWDLIRYAYQPLESYKTNLDRLFSRLAEVLSPQCLVIWNMTMPVGFKAGEMAEYTKHNLRWDVIEGNFYSSTLANLHKMDVVDMHYHFRFDLRSRCRDAIHWNQLAHRKYSQILLAHIAQAWGVKPPKAPKVKSEPVQNDPPHVVPLNVPHPQLHDPPHVVPLRNVPHPQLHYVQDGGLHGFGHPLPCAAPLPVLPLPNVPHLHPQYNDQNNGQHYIGPMYFEGYTSFDVTGDSDVIETFGRGPSGCHGNALSPFVDDSPILCNFPPRNVNFGGFGKMEAPMFGNHPFSGMAFNPYHMAVPEMQFGTFHYNASWSGHPRFPRRRDMRPPRGWMPPYYRPPRFSNRI